VVDPWGMPAGLSTNAEGRFSWIFRGWARERAAPAASISRWGVDHVTTTLRSCYGLFDKNRKMKHKS
jgi:hypothetical protein